MADAKLPGVAVTDIGRCALGILSDPQRFIGTTVGIANDHLTGVEMAAALTRHLDEEVRYVPDTIEQVRKWDSPLAAEVANQWQYKIEFNDTFTVARDLELVRAINPELHTIDSWLTENSKAIKEGLA